MSNQGDKYVKLTQLEHILRRPDTYIGSTEPTTELMWIIDNENKLVQKNITFVPGMLKIFDEILVNAADNKIRDPTMKKIEVIIDAEQNMIQVKNDGKGIPVEIHSKEKIYVPELIFGHLLTSSNYDDDEKKVTGGRNGYGAKLCNIFSTRFELETADKASGQGYKQLWENNMSVCNKAKITKSKKTEFTRIAFSPDLAKFGMEKLDDDTLGLLKRRVYDIAGSVKGVSVYLNGEKVPLRDFKSYIQLYLESAKRAKDGSFDDDETSDAPVIVYEKSDRWEIAFSVSETSFNQVSFVNSIATTSGGTHVNYIADQIVNKTMEFLKKKHKNAHVKPFQIRNNMFLFVNCLIENPAFTSQTKEQMITKVSSFGSKFQISEEFIKKVIKTEFIQQILDIAQANADKQLQKTDGAGRKNRVVVSKLEDANKAGTKDSEHCTLILTEGDSAKALAVSGLKVVGRDYYGVFPLRGKLLNVRDATTDQIMKNQEIKNLKKIIGLQHKKKYDSVKGLRYGHIMIMTDQDYDGSHIKGLVINFIESSFPGLLSIPGFLLEFITPIVKVTLGKNTQPKLFYTMPEYENWIENEGNRVKFKSKYYKGLGTSDSRDMMRYFSNLDHHIKRFDTLKIEDKDLLELAFAKKKADDRKNWLAGFELGTHLDPNLKIIPYDDFINKELILFSMADNIRSIPSLCDGFKPAQRKILYTFFKKNIVKELKVNDLQGYVSSTSNYHHGDASLVQTIVGLAQDYVGSNNIYLLSPNGCFGTRDVGGKDHAAARYIYTELSKITKHIFKEEDQKLLNYIKDDERTVEPYWYLPIIPMVLVNGAEGIGTGWSTSVPQYNPDDIVANIKRLLNGQEMESMIPWFRNWKGTVIPAGPDKFKMFGRIERIDDNTLVISEIPAKTWTCTVKEFIENALINTTTEKVTEKFIKNYTEQDDLEGHKFIITLSDEQMKKTEKVGYYERFKLIQNIGLGNMILFNERGKLQKYESPLEIIQSYYFVRLEYYQKRKDYLTSIMREELSQLTAKARFIKLIIDKKLVISNRKRVLLVGELQKLNFPRFGKDGRLIEDKASEAEITQDDINLDNEDDEEDAGGVEDELSHSPDTIYSSYDYLLNMPLWSLTKEKYEKLLKQKDAKDEELNLLLTKSAKDLWLIDLDGFEVAYAKFLKDDKEKMEFEAFGNGKKPTKKRSRKKANDDDDDFMPTAKKTKKKATKKADADEMMVIKGEFIEPEIKEVKPKKTRVKKEASTEPDILSQVSNSKMNGKVKKETSDTPLSAATDSNKENSSDRMSNIMGRAKTIFGSIEPKEEEDDSNNDLMEVDEKDLDDDIFSRFSAAANKFDTSFSTDKKSSTASVEPEEKPTKGKAAAKKTTATKKAVPAKNAVPAKKTAPVKKAAPKKATKKNKFIISDDEDEIMVDDDDVSDDGKDEVEVVITSPIVKRKPQRRAATTKKKVEYIESDFESAEDEEPEVSEEESEYDDDDF
ncbi:DNA topoisomerase 2 [Saccharomycopsis crataegensis]|uniref:DNA topoisomerase 2 n=1 Tax=Saccharomycopsis crataegensis TaxID=43959 RepID=A0AAV5QKC6_9ASCO|nr:DNA topoisomerase 2 [Saccharomycopsis crataegensis]